MGAELIRLVAITTVILVGVIAFAAAVKPLADGKIGPLETLKFMGLAMVPMLQYALPFSAGFGATLAYHRFAQDNEAVASYAGGVSHRAVLLPAGVLGLVLAVALAGLSHEVIPRFLVAMERLITQDLAKIMVAQVERGQSVERDGMMVYADGARRIEPPTRGSEEQLLLSRMAAVELDEQGLVQSEATASVAHLWLYPSGVPAEAGEDAPDRVRRIDEDAGRAQIRLERAVHALRGRSIAEGNNLDVFLPAPNSFKDDPKFLTFAELRALRERPEGMNWIESRRRDLAFHLAERMTMEEIGRRLATAGRIVLRDDEGNAITVRASGLALSMLRWNLIPVAGEKGIEVDQQRGSGEQAIRWTARAAALYTSLGPDQARRELSIRLEMDDASPRGAAGDGPAAQRASVKIANLALDEGPLDELLDRERTPALKLIELVRPRVESATPDPLLAPPFNDLTTSVAKLRREVMSKQHERAAMSVACLVMVVSGAVTALMLTHSLPLTVYLWSFFPALATVITISSGQQMTHEEGPIGLVLLWGGVVAFAAASMFTLRSVARH